MKPTRDDVLFLRFKTSQERAERSRIVWSHIAFENSLKKVRTRQLRKHFAPVLRPKKLVSFLATQCENAKQRDIIWWHDSFEPFCGHSRSCLAYLFRNQRCEFRN